MAKETEPTEMQAFEKDKCKTVAAKNRKLAVHLNSIWLKFETIKVQRIESDVDSGWEITYRQ